MSDEITVIERDKPEPKAVLYKPDGTPLVYKKRPFGFHPPNEKKK